MTTSDPGEGRYETVRFDGHLDIGRYPEFRDAFQGARAGVPVIVDLRSVTGVDSVFLTELLMFRRRRRPTPVATVIDSTGNVARVFAIADIGTKLDVYNSVDEAVRSFGPDFSASHTS